MDKILVGSMKHMKGWDNSVSTVTRLRAVRPGFDPPQGQGRGPTQPPNHLVPGALSSRGKAAGT